MNNLISSDQFGLRKERSPENQLILTYSEIDAGLTVDVALLDFSKAFHLASHSIFLGKLRDLGGYPVLIGWVHAFLSDRTMQVMVSGY